MHQNVVMAVVTAATLTAMCELSSATIRYAGAKGMLTLCPDMRAGRQLELRPSMIKFESPHRMLECICYISLKYSRTRHVAAVNNFTMLTTGAWLLKVHALLLEPALIMVLSSRGVRNSAFQKLLEDMLQALAVMMTNEDAAMDALLKYASLGSGDDPAARAPMQGAWDLLAAGALTHALTHYNACWHCGDTGSDSRATCTLAAALLQAQGAALPVGAHGSTETEPVERY
eukprot:2094-Heterococcus_DN1.PRE.1